MIRALWMVGAVFLFACGVESAPVATQAPAGEAVASSALAQTASSGQIVEVCTPGESRLCCPFPQGCSCPGEQWCEEDGEWDECYGPTRSGPCL